MYFIYNNKVFKKCFLPLEKQIFPQKYTTSENIVQVISTHFWFLIWLWSFVKSEFVND